MKLKRPLIIAAAVMMAVALVGAALVGPLGVLAHSGSQNEGQRRIEHVVVIFQENVSFDHYFGSYPHATNPAGEPRFTPRTDTPTVNGLSPALLNRNPNLANPQRLDRSQAVTCDQDHRYLDEQKAVDSGLMDKFVEFASGGSCVDANQNPSPNSYGRGRKIVMDYYDGNTVTALWNYAQRFAMSDNSYGTSVGPSTVGALNLIAGQTHGATAVAFPNNGTNDSENVTNNIAHGTVIGDPGPAYDDCAVPSYSTRVSMSGKNVGDLLNAKGQTWGWFQGGFHDCSASHTNIAGGASKDYIPHHEPFQYFQSTANPHHVAPSSVAEIGHAGPANHQYDLSDFWAAVNAGNMPAVSYLKAAAYQDGHAGYSDPLDEQTFLVNTINALQKSKNWDSTAVVIAYDDSDGWYDHALAPVVSTSSDPHYDALAGAGLCGSTSSAAYLGAQDRCGYAVRQPLMVISPFARHNFVDHSITDQSSILSFIEDTWTLGRIGAESGAQSFDAIAGSLNGMLDFGADESGGSRLILDSSTGQPN
jgi:phospholipase C